MVAAADAQSVTDAAVTGSHTPLMVYKGCTDANGIANAASVSARAMGAAPRHDITPGIGGWAGICDSNVGLGHVPWLWYALDLVDIPYIVCVDVRACMFSR
jgi:purine nucleoside permease